MTQDTVEIRQAQQVEKQPARHVSLNEVVADVQALTTLLGQESRALKAMDIETVKNLHEEKLRLIKKIELQKRIIKLRPNLLDRDMEVDESLMLSIDKKLQQVARQNFNEVLAAKEVNKQVMDALSKAAAQYEHRASYYNNKGAGAGSRASLRKNGVSVALNEQV